MSKYKLVPVEPTPEMMEAARNAPMPMILIDSIAGRQDLTNASVYRAMLAAAPAVQGELVGWQFYKHGKWWNGDILTENQRKKFEKEGVRVRNVYAEPQLAEHQPATDVHGEPVGYVRPHHLEALRSGKACGITLEDKPDAHNRVTIPLYTAPQPAPDVEALVEALKASTHGLHEQADGEDDCRCSQCRFVRLRDAALSAYRKGGE